ncbi:hypothetical protein [Moorena producens]|uniref:hypothetical protein n=1 Tax=Moorena producens TaxID=1155739 RepID=UPI003C783311
MIQGYKSSIERLANLFKQSRDRWKQRAQDKQRKLRAQQIRIRDLQKSRELWKQRAQTAEKMLRDYQSQEKTPARQRSDYASASPPRH